jgi:uncharacterized membrane protein YphA (DoxX/SURF4 family)
MLRRTTIIEIITVLNIILFLYTGIAKLMDYSLFKEQLAASPILEPIAKPVALLLPWIEFAIVLLLVIPRWRLKGLYSSLALMIVFTVYIIALFSFSKEMPCSCGGIIELLSWKQHLIFNGAFILLNIWAIVMSRKEKKEFAKKQDEKHNYGFA